MVGPTALPFTESEPAHVPTGTAKDTVKTVQRQHTQRVKIFANHVPDKGLVSRVYKEFLQLNNKKTNNSMKK